MSRDADLRRSRYHARKAILLEEWGGRCVDCGATENLEFDHIDPATKIENVTLTIYRGLEAARVEAAKCELRCRPCHESRTAAQNRRLPGYRSAAYLEWLSSRSQP